MKAPDNSGEPPGEAMKHFNGPHAGTLLRTPHELIEVSIFENAGAAYFRLYFYDHAGQPSLSRALEIIKLQTVRPNGEEEHFALRPNDEALCLESMSPVARPFVFTVKVSIDRSGIAHTCETKFDERTRS